MSDLTPFEKIGIRNGLNKVICPFVLRMGRDIVEARLCLENRDTPNVEMCLRRLRDLEKLVDGLEKERIRWNEEL